MTSFRGRTTTASAEDMSPACQSRAAAGSLLLLGTLLLLPLLATGCKKPSFYRRQADADAYCMIDQKAAVLGEEPGDYRINIDPRSRMYDPNNPDCEPMPPDDPTSNLYMQCVDCKKGEKCWKCLPKTPFVENPAWYEYLPRDENGQLVLDLQGAVELALLESPSYQSQLEELYLSALDVTFERFRFDTQFFGGTGVDFQVDGELNSGTSRNIGGNNFRIPTSTLTAGSNRFQLQKLNAVGGQFVAGFANSLMWQLSGPDNYSSNTLLDFTFIQPLLRGSGRGRVLERLTITERSLLANVRQMERYRRGFYNNIYIGDNPGQGPSRRGGFFGGSGLEGFSGVGGGGFGRVGGGGFFGGGGGGNTGGAGAEGAGGYLGLLQNEQILRNQRANVAALRESVLQLEASNEAGRIDRFQVDLARQALYTAQSQLLSAENSYQAQLENFLVSIGLPPELNVKIRDSMLDRLNLLDPDLELLQEHVATTLLELRELREARDAEPANGQPAEPLVLPNLAEEVPRPAADDLSATINGHLASLGDLREVAEQRLVAVQADFETLESSLPDRRENLERLASRAEVQDANIDPGVFSVEQLEQRVAKRKTEFEALQIQLNQTFQQLDALANTESVDGKLDELIDVYSTLSSQLLELSLAQASARLEAISFDPIELSPEQALAIASNYRRDWMNARANLVDSWRLIYFNANDLQSDLDLVFNGDIGNVGDNPFRFRDTRGSLRVGLEFDAPLTRLAERNVYRQSLIEYQQARRSYYQFRDGIYQGLRNTIRQIRLNEINFELRRAAVEVAISQVDLTQLRLIEPPQPGEISQLGNTTARDLVQSLSDLLNVQNDFLSVWVNYEVQRLSLEQDLGVMQLAPNGLRIENNIPFDTYMASVTLNSSDLGPIVMEKLLSQQVELVQPPTSLPDTETYEQPMPEAQPLPPPVEQQSSAQDSDNALQLISVSPTATLPQRAQESWIPAEIPAVPLPVSKPPERKSG